MSLTHEERRQRRAAIAEDARNLIATSPVHKRELLQILSNKYQVGAPTVEMALKEHNISIKFPKNDDKIVRVEQSARIQTILGFLKDTTLTYREIAEKIGVTKAYIQLVHKQLISDGYDVPLREEVRERLRIAKQEELHRKDEEFVRLYVESNDFEGSAEKAGISVLRANKVRKKHRLNATGLLIDRNLCEEYPSLKITRRLLYIVADLLYTDLPLTLIAEKWKKNKPFVFNLADECRKAGLKLGEHKDGRQSPRNKPPARVKICKQCGCEFKSWRRLPDGTVQRSYAYRVHCLDCKPFEGKNKLQESSKRKSRDDKDLQESASN